MDLSIPLTVAFTTGVGLAILTGRMPAIHGLKGILVWLARILLMGAAAGALPAWRAYRVTVRDTGARD